MNLFEPTFGTPLSSLCRAVWTAPLAREAGAPERRIIHLRALRSPVPVRLRRLGLRRGRGYFKCGGDPAEPDQATSARVLIGDGVRWTVLREVHDPSVPQSGVAWLDLDGAEAAAVSVELRRAQVEGWWPSWNLAATGLLLEGEPTGPAPEQPEGLLSLAECRFDALPRGVSASRSAGEVRYRTKRLEVGFRLRRAALSYLAIRELGPLANSPHRSLLLGGSYDVFSHPLRDYLVQGIRLAPVAGPPASSFFAYAVEGETRIAANRVRYDVRLVGTGVAYRLEWEVLEDRLLVSVVRTGERDLRAWESGALHLALDCRVAPVSTVGRLVRQCETGLLDLPVLLHAPGYGTLSVAARGDARWRADAARPVFAATGELKVGEVPQPEGDYLLPAGRYAAEVQFTVGTPRLIRTRHQAPQPVRKALAGFGLSALPLRPDVASLSNNGCSQQAPMCMDLWSALATRLGDPLGGLPATNLLRWSVERWLDGGHGYASGVSSRTMQSYDDEYLITPVACLQGIADYLEATSDVAWLEERAVLIGAQIEALRGRDRDADGLIESTIRRGVSGEHQWSTNWLDIVSFGWKDAWTNALLHRLLLSLERVLPRLGKPGMAEGLAAWAARLRDSYLPTFLNERTGWIAGWRCAEGRLHDHAFLYVNGCAVTSGVLEAPLARQVMERLWAEMQRVGFDDFRLGLPFNLWKVPDEDMGTWNYGRPRGWYANGGATLSQARHFVAALYQVGMHEEADGILEAMCASLADGSAIGGCTSGVDLRTWDGTPGGYEGLLCDQLGVLVPAIDRWGVLSK